MDEIVHSNGINQEKGLIRAEQAPRPEDPSSIGIVEALERTNKPFDKALFQTKLKELQLIDTGGIFFIPLVWGSPGVGEGITEENELLLNQQPEAQLTYPSNTLREPKPHKESFGSWVYEDYSSEPDPMTVGDVSERVQKVQTFDSLRFPHKSGRYNQNNGGTVLTDTEGNVSFSLNAPYPLMAGEDSQIKLDRSLPVPYEETIETKI